MKTKNSVIILTIAIMILAMLLTTIYILNNINRELNAKLESEIRIKNALTDVVKAYQIKEVQWKNEKLLLNNIKNGNELNIFQKKLDKKLEEIQIINSITAATLIEISMKIDSIKK